LLLARAGYAAFFARKMQEIHIPGGVCSGSLTTAIPKPAAINESALVLVYCLLNPLSFVAFKMVVYEA
jgi:hypothetical protein